MHLKLITLLVLMISVRVPGAWAQTSPWEKMREERNREAALMFEQLGLSDEQKKLLEDNKARQDHNRLSYKANRELYQKLNQELMKPELDMAQVNVIRQQLRDAQFKKVDSRIDSIIEVRRILTPEQFAKFSALAEANREERYKRFGAERK